MFRRPIDDKVPAGVWVIRQAFVGEPIGVVVV